VGTEVEDELAACRERRGVDLELDDLDGEEKKGEEEDEEEVVQLGFARGGVHGVGFGVRGTAGDVRSSWPAAAEMTLRSFSNSSGRLLP